MLKHYFINNLHSYIAEFKLRFYVLLDTNTGLNFLFIVEVPPLGKCRPRQLAPPTFCYATEIRWFEGNYGSF